MRRVIETILLSGILLILAGCASATATPLATFKSPDEPTATRQPTATPTASKIAATPRPTRTRTPSVQFIPATDVSTTVIAVTGVPGPISTALTAIPPRPTSGPTPTFLPVPSIIPPPFPPPPLPTIPPITGSGIIGTVTRGPMCPVYPEDDYPRCDNEPFEASIYIYNLSDQLVTLTRSDSNGYFKVLLPPGDYRVHAESFDAGFFPYAPDQIVTIYAGQFTQVYIMFDTGIRHPDPVPIPVEP